MGVPYEDDPLEESDTDVEDRDWVALVSSLSLEL